MGIGDTTPKTIQRNELYTYADFLSICGGLLGVFMGISALSFIELIYFATLHLFWKLRDLKAKNTVTVTPAHQDDDVVTSTSHRDAWI